MLHRLAVTVRRNPVLYWVLVALAALVARVGVVGSWEAARAERARWGHSRTVLVVTENVRAGGPVSAAVVERREMPDAVVPVDAVTDLPKGAVARDDLVVGEVLAARRLATGGGAIAGRLRDGERAVTVSRPDSAPPAEVNDAVDLYGTVEAEVDLAGSGRVIAVHDHDVTVAVPASQVRRVVAAMAHGTITVATRPGHGVEGTIRGDQGRGLSQ
jgi:Flp pilus assembly protein CpaB